MQVGKIDLETLFHKPVWYEIPVFQRQYVWEEDEQWEPLWNDVRNTTERWLRAEESVLQSRYSPSHFLGAVVLQQKQTPSSERLQTRLVVDGQQRLTTLQLFANAVKEVFEEHGQVIPAEALSPMVRNSENLLGGNPDRAFKVWPTLADRESFKFAMSSELANAEHEESQIVKAHVFFKSQIDNWLAQEPSQLDSRVAALERVIIHQLELVVIDLEVEDDLHIIFETLNARGTPLLESDLIKNMVMYQAEGAGISTSSGVGQQLWRFDEADWRGWWHGDIAQGRLVRSRLDVFFNYWLVVQTQDEVAAKDVFSVFRRLYGDERPTAESVTQLSQKIHQSASHYRALEDGTQPEMGKFLYRRGVMQAGVITPVLISLLDAQTPQPQLGNALNAIESYLIRRMLLRKTSNNYNRLFVGLLKALQESGPEYADATVVRYLGEQTAATGNWPDDHELEQALIAWPLFKLLTRARLRIVLEGIEEDLRTNLAETQEVLKGLTIEHILPRHWRGIWPEPRHMEDPDSAARNRDDLLHSIGNLTLVNRRLNSRLSNVPWEQKKADLSNHSILFLNKTLLENAPAVWDEAAIEQRGRQLAQAAIRVWPHADKF